MFSIVNIYFYCGSIASYNTKSLLNTIYIGVIEIKLIKTDKILSSMRKID